MTFRKAAWEAAVDEYNKAESEGRLAAYRSMQAFHFEQQKAINDVNIISLNIYLSSRLVQLALRLANWRNHCRDHAKQYRATNQIM